MTGPSTRFELLYGTYVEIGQKRRLLTSTEKTHPFSGLIYLDFYLIRVFAV